MIVHFIRVITRATSHAVLALLVMALVFTGFCLECGSPSPASQSMDGAAVQVVADCADGHGSDGCQGSLGCVCDCACHQQIAVPQDHAFLASGGHGDPLIRQPVAVCGESAVHEIETPPVIA